MVINSGSEKKIAPPNARARPTRNSRSRSRRLLIVPPASRPVYSEVVFVRDALERYATLAVIGRVKRFFRIASQPP
jgi:hypothetical protein